MTLTQQLVDSLKLEEWKENKRLRELMLHDAAIQKDRKLQEWRGRGA